MSGLKVRVMLAAVLAGAILAVPGELSSPCLEDMPCWDCSSMGNGICGKEQVCRGDTAV